MPPHLSAVSLVTANGGAAAGRRTADGGGGGRGGPGAAGAFGGVGGSPLFIDKAVGQFLYDLDGNKYLDFIGSWGPMILGHCHPKVVEATVAALHRGTSYGAPCEAESQLAEWQRKASDAWFEKDKKAP